MRSTAGVGGVLVADLSVGADGGDGDVGVDGAGVEVGVGGVGWGVLDVGGDELAEAVAGREDGGEVDDGGVAGVGVDVEAELTAGCDVSRDRRRNSDRSDRGHHHRCDGGPGPGEAAISTAQAYWAHASSVRHRWRSPELWCPDVRFGKTRRSGRVFPTRPGRSGAERSANPTDRCAEPPSRRRTSNHMTPGMSIAVPS